MIKENNSFDEAWLEERAEYFEGVYDDLMALRNEGVFQNKNIALVGSWNNAGEINIILKQLGLMLTNIADNNPNKQGVSRLGIISQSVESLVGESNLVILVANNFFWKDIKNQLLKLGLTENQDFYIIFGGNKFKLLSCMTAEKFTLASAEWNKCKMRAEMAYESYNQINKRYKGLPIWLMHQPSLGDLYVFSLFLPHAMSAASVSQCECVLIVTKNSTKNLAHVLGFKHVELITFDEAHKNWLLLMRMMGEHLNVRNAVYHGLNNIFQSLVHYSKVSFRDSFTKYVFRFRDEVEPIYPTFPKRTEHVAAQFNEYGLIPGKTVVISPYAGHFTAQISETQWELLVSTLKEKGYSICTNCGSSNESPLPGTKAPFIELQDCVEFVEMAGYFIGIRSGFCDLVCKANCQKIVIYETGAPAASIEYFGFQSMGIGNEIVELVNDCIHVDDLINQILEMFQTTL